MYRKQLYKKDSKGKIRTIIIKTDGAELLQETGILDGKLVPTKKTCKAKNIGRSNETTPAEQAILEAKSRITKKLTEGYFNTITEAETSKVLLPMLAKNYEDHKNKIIWTGFVGAQRKLDGIRGVSTNDKIISRKNRIIETMTHIQDELATLLDKDITLDGELYKYGATFQENTRLIKKYRPGESENIKYHIYDVMLDEPYLERKKYLESLEIKIKENSHLVFVKTEEINSEKELKALHQKFLKEGYEGTMVRHGDKPYKNNARCDSLLKYKDFIDITAVVIDITPAEQQTTWGVPVLMLANGKTFRSGVKGSHEYREYMLANKHEFIGKTAEIRFFEYTEDKVPRFPVFYGIRLDK